MPRHHGEDGHGVVVVSVIFVSVLIGEVCCKRDQRQHTQDGLQHGSHLWTYRLDPVAELCGTARGPDHEKNIGTQEEGLDIDHAIGDRKGKTRQVGEPEHHGLSGGAPSHRGAEERQPDCRHTKVVE